MQARSDKSRFVLKEPNGDKSTPILLLYRYKNDRLKYSTGEAIHPDQWDAITQQARTDQKSRKDREPSQVINSQLARYRATLNRVLAQLSLAEVTPTVEEVRLHLDKEFKKEPVKKDQPKPVTFFEYAEQFLSDCKNRETTDHGEPKIFCHDDQKLWDDDKQSNRLSASLSHAARL